MLFQVVKDCGRAYKALEISTIVDIKQPEKTWILTTS